MKVYWRVRTAYDILRFGMVWWLDGRSILHTKLVIVEPSTGIRFVGEVRFVETTTYTTQKYRAQLSEKLFLHLARLRPNNALDLQMEVR